MIIFHNRVLSIEFTDEIVNSLKAYTQDFHHLHESGGILMGKRLLNGNIIVTNITTPQQGDVIRRCYFKKNKKVHQKISDKIWIGSKGKIIYIGEWHTHPEPIPHPSSVDLRGWQLSVQNQKDEKTYIFLIVGIKEFGLWSYSKANGLLKMEMDLN